jgi:hypothetical protein
MAASGEVSAAIRSAGVIDRNAPKVPNGGPRIQEFACPKHAFKGLP